MSDYYLPWSDTLKDFAQCEAAPLDIDECEFYCEHENAAKRGGVTDWRAARIYTPDEIASLERDRERLEWILDRRGTIHVGQYFVGDRSEIDVSMTDESMRRLRRTESAIYRSMKGGE